MRSPIQFIFPREISMNLQVTKEWPPACDHKIPFATPVWIQFDMGEFLAQSIDGGDYRIESRSATLIQPLHLYIKVEKPCISIAMVLDGMLEGRLGPSIVFNLDAKNYSIFYLPRGIQQLILGSGKYRWFCIFPPLLYLKHIAAEEAGTREITGRLSAHDENGMVRPGIPLPAKLLRILKQLQLTRSRGAVLDFELRRYIQEILSIYYEQLKMVPAKKPGYQSPQQKVIAVRDYILAHLGDMDLGGLNEMAMRFHTSTKSLNNAFFKLTGKTIPQFIGDERLEWARRLLEKKEMHVFEIAWITGFSDTANFNRKFKKKYGCPPLNRKRK